MMVCLHNYAYTLNTNGYKRQQLIATLAMLYSLQLGLYKVKML